MKYHELQSRPRSRVKKRSNALLYFAGGLVVLSVIVFSLYTFQKRHGLNMFVHSSGAGSDSEASETQPSPTNIDLEAGAGSGLSGSSENRIETPGGTSPSPFSSGPYDSSSEATALVQKNDNPTDLLSGKKAQLSKNQQVMLMQTINDFYIHLDRQPYLKTFKLKESSRVHFSHLLQKLIDHPPVVADETNDLFTLLKNTAHFFRILGKDNIIMLKGILDHEKSSFENILKTFYALTDYPEALAREYSLTLPRDALYDYAGFFLNTMGGRLYLFRRDSISRMAVSFYSILLMDRAGDEGANKYGIDLRPSIDSLISEIENTGNKLLLKEKYLDTLYDLKEKYN
jgi:hypothetical protein